jgi:hypothetical protein
MKAILLLSANSSIDPAGIEAHTSEAVKHISAAEYLAHSGLAFASPEVTITQGGGGKTMAPSNSSFHVPGAKSRKQITIGARFPPLTPGAQSPTSDVLGARHFQGRFGIALMLKGSPWGRFGAQAQVTWFNKRASRPPLAAVS